MAQYAIAYSPTATGGTANTTQTGSFYIGNMTTRAWNQTVTATGGNTFYYGSPLANVSNVFPYIIAIPKAGASPTQPQFFYSMLNGTFNQSDAAFVATADWVLKHYANDGSVNFASPANPAGCADVASCKAALTSAGWFNSYSFVPPA
jgi:hypothetical protein